MLGNFYQWKISLETSSNTLPDSLFSLFSRLSPRTGIFPYILSHSINFAITIIFLGASSSFVPSGATVPNPSGLRMAIVSLVVTFISLPLLILTNRFVPFLYTSSISRLSRTQSHSLSLFSPHQSNHNTLYPPHRSSLFPSLPLGPLHPSRTREALGPLPHAWVARFDGCLRVLDGLRDANREERHLARLGIW